jgi:hypothetical protein
MSVKQLSSHLYSHLYLEISREEEVLRFESRELRCMLIARLLPADFPP